jgi:hypothetical protein
MLTEAVDYMDLSIRGVGLSLLVQSGEFLALQAPLRSLGINPVALQSQDWLALPAFMRKLMHVFSQPRVYRNHLYFRILSCLACIGLGANIGLLWLALLWLGTLLILIRWRGAFNGGSDFMTLVVLMGLMLSVCAQALGMPWAARIGLLFIALQSASSYFVSGAIKTRQPDWRSGRALVVFLDGGIYGPLPLRHPLRRPRLALFASYGFIIWEMSIVIALFSPTYMLIFCGLGVLFHLGVFWYLGLNRFIFAWLATYPALYYLSTQLSLR